MRWFLCVLALAVQLPVQALEAEQVLARAKQAAGGEGWDKVRNIHSEGKAKVSGYDTDREEWVDLWGVRFGQSFRVGFIGGGLGFDGKTAWGKQPNQGAETTTSGKFFEGQRSNACRKSLTYWYPKRCAAKLEYKGQQQDDNHQFQVIVVIPKDATPFELWFDNETYLLARTRTEGSQVFLSFSDYRTVNGLKFPFLSRAGKQESRLETVEFNVPITDERYLAPVSNAKTNRKG